MEYHKRELEGFIFSYHLLVKNLEDQLTTVSSKKGTLKEGKVHVPHVVRGHTWWSVRFDWLRSISKMRI